MGDLWGERLGVEEARCAHPSAAKAGAPRPHDAREGRGLIPRDAEPNLCSTVQQYDEHIVPDGAGTTRDS